MNPARITDRFETLNGERPGFRRNQAKDVCVSGSFTSYGERAALGKAAASEKLLYGLMIALPIVGWGMLSATRYPVVIFGPVHLPPILTAGLSLYAVCTGYTVVAYLLFLTLKPSP